MWPSRPSFTKAPTQKSSASMLWVPHPQSLSRAHVAIAVLQKWLKIRLRSSKSINLASVLCVTFADQQDACV